MNDDAKSESAQSTSNVLAKWAFSEQKEFDFRMSLIRSFHFINKEVRILESVLAFLVVGLYRCTLTKL
jgi:hypothetical protein